MEIKFKGKSINTDLYVYGFLFIDKHKYYILESISNPIEVYPESAVQFTNKYDKQGTEIYNKDIVEINEQYSDEDTSTHYIYWDMETSKYTDIRLEDGDSLSSYLDNSISWLSDATLIGSLFDNPDYNQYLK